MHAITGDHVLWAIAYSWGPTVLSHTHTCIYTRLGWGGKEPLAPPLQGGSGSIGGTDGVDAANSPRT